MKYQRVYACCYTRQMDSLPVRKHSAQRYLVPHHIIYTIVCR